MRKAERTVLECVPDYSNFKTAEEIAEEAGYSVSYTKKVLTHLGRFGFVDRATVGWTRFKKPGKDVKA